MFNVNIDLAALGMTAFMRPRAGAVPQEGGKYADADVEICISLCVGTSKQSGVLDAVGKKQGQMVPVATFFRSLDAFVAQARFALGGDVGFTEPNAHEGLSLVPPEAPAP